MAFTMNERIAIVAPGGAVTICDLLSSTPPWAAHGAPQAALHWGWPEVTSLRIAGRKPALPSGS